MTLPAATGWIEPIEPLTLEEFFEALATRRPPDGWCLRNGQIEVTGVTWCCPWLWIRRDGRRYEPRADIFAAADNSPGADPDLRARLLAVCGL